MSIIKKHNTMLVNNTKEVRLGTMTSSGGAGSLTEQVMAKVGLESRLGAADDNAPLGFRAMAVEIKVEL